LQPPGHKLITDHWKGVAYTLAGALLLSPAGLFIKVLDQGPFQINLYRSLVAALTIILVLRLRRQPLHLDLSPASLACGVCYALVMVLFVAATKLTTAANAVLLQYTSPVFLLVLEPWWFHLPFSRRDLVAVVACLVSLVLFFTGHLERGSTLGNLLALASGLSLALVSLILKIIQQRHPEREPYGLVILGNLMVVAMCLPLALPHLAVTARQALALVFLGVFQIGLSWMLVVAGLKYISATTAVLTRMSEAVFCIVWVAMGIHELPSRSSLLGGAILLGVLVWYNLGGCQGQELDRPQARSGSMP